MIKQVILLLFSISLLFSSEDFKTIQQTYAKSYTYEQVEKYKEAIQTLSSLYKKYPKGYTLNLRLGWLFYLDKKYKDSVKYYNKASLVNTYALEPQLGLVRAYLATYSYEKAQNISAEILKKDYYSYYGNLYMCKALIGQKKYEAAIKESKKMLAIYPTNVLFLEELFISYKATNNKLYQDVYESIIILDPNNVFVRNVP